MGLQHTWAPCGHGHWSKGAHVWVAEAGEAPPIGDRGGHRWGTRGNTYMRESKVGADLHGYMEVLGVWYPNRMCVFNIYFVDTDISSYYGRHPKQSCPITSSVKRADILRLDLRYDATSRRLCYHYMGLWGRGQRRQKINCLLTCQINGIGNTWQRAGMCRTVSNRTWCGLPACWCRGHEVVSPA